RGYLAVTRPLFFYGTLRPELAPPDVAELLARLTPLGPATVAGRLYDLGPYPGLVLDQCEPGRVHGALFAPPADPAVLTALDDYEGFDPADPAAGLFRRVECEAIADGRAVTC